MSRNSDDLIIPAWIIAFSLFFMAVVCAYGLYKVEKAEAQFNEAMKEQGKAFEKMRKAVD